MKKLVKFLTGLLLVVGVGLAAYKASQKILWDNKASFVNPPSLNSWDPTERFEAARQAAKKYGGKG